MLMIVRMHLLTSFNFFGYAMKDSAFYSPHSDFGFFSFLGADPAARARSFFFSSPGRTSMKDRRLKTSCNTTYSLSPLPLVSLSITFSLSSLSLSITFSLSPSLTLVSPPSLSSSAAERAFVCPPPSLSLRFSCLGLLWLEAKEVLCSVG